VFLALGEGQKINASIPNYAVTVALSHCRTHGQGRHIVESTGSATTNCTYNFMFELLGAYALSQRWIAVIV